MRVIDLDGGVTLSAANDDDLFKCVREHFDEQRSGDDSVSDDEIRQLIDKRAYDAMDS